jgi:PTS system fructose-specific IIC component
MNNTLWVIIEAQATGVNAFLAAEALRKAAEKRGAVIAVEIRTPETVFSPLQGEPVPGDVLLLAGKVEAEEKFSRLPTIRANINNVLLDVGGILDSLERAAASAGQPTALDDKKRIVAITSCPTGIAHTFMAAEGLQKAADALGYDIRIETQGSVGAGTPLTPKEIAGADLVIIAADREVDRSRFNGKRLFASGTKPFITDGQNMMRRAVAEAVVQNPAAGAANETPEKAGQRPGPYKHLMTGVSFMLPFVVAGGLLIALSFALGGIDVDNKPGTLGYVLKLIGGQGGFALVVPVLAGYIAYSVADRPGIAPGMIGGTLCNILGAGFLGGIAAGFLAGYGTQALNTFIRLPKNLAGLKPVLILPLLGTLLTCLVLFYVVGVPVAQLNAFLTGWLRGLQGGSSIALGMLLAGMMAVDMGGPVNKAAFAFSTGMLESGIYMPMAAVMAGGMVPPMAAAISTRLFKNRYTAEERESGSAVFVLGLAFISEGAIPFAARDPLRVIPSFVAGAAVAGGVSMGLGIGLMAPHGGIFVLAIPNVVSDVVGYAAAIAAGTAVSALLLGLLKKDLRLENAPAPEASA